VTAADALTLFRALAGIPIVFALAFNGRAFALALFAVAALSDALDGWLARRSGTVTDHGAILDPLADKAVVLATLAGLSLVGGVPLPLAVAIAARELLVERGPAAVTMRDVATHAGVSAETVYKTFRTKATLIYRRTKNLRAVQLLLGHTKLESTVRYLGIEVNDALEMAEQTEV